MKLSLILTNKFKKSLNLARKRGLNIDLLDDIVEKLLNNIPSYSVCLVELEVIALFRHSMNSGF